LSPPPVTPVDVTHIQAYLACHMTNSTNRVHLIAKYLQQCFCSWWQNRHFRIIGCDL